MNNLSASKIFFQNGYNQCINDNIDPLPDMCNKIKYYSDEIFTLLKDKCIHTHQLKTDIEYFLIQAAADYDRNKWAVGDENMRDLLSMFTIVDIALELYKYNDSLETYNSFVDYKKRLCINRLDLCAKKGIDSSQLLRVVPPTANNNLKALVQLFYMKKNIEGRFVISRKDKDFINVDNKFSQWKRDCFTNHYYYLCAAQSLPGKLLLEQITPIEFDSSFAELAHIYVDN